MKSYLELKRAMLGAGLFSCSQAGFNVAMGDLPQLRHRLTSLVSALLGPATHWEVPPLIRADWIPAGVWDNPPEAQWMRSAPLDHVLTPLPAMHLLNRLRHHPEEGAYVLSGWCARQEADTLPLLRQVAFYVLERVEVKLQPGAELTGQGALDRLHGAALQLDLPVELTALPGGLGQRIDLVLPDTARVPLACYRDLPSRLLDSYSLAGARADRVGCGLERWCLAVIARHGVDAANWPSQLLVNPRP